MHHALLIYEYILNEKNDHHSRVIEVENENHDLNKNKKNSANLASTSYHKSVQNQPRRMGSALVGCHSTI